MDRLHFTNPDFPENKRQLKFDLFDWDMVKDIAEHGGQSLLVGMVRLSGHGINNIEKATGIDLRPFFNEECRKSKRDYHYSKEEIRAYYERIHALCKVHGIEFTTCYIGNGEAMFWSDQELWDNKKDCCNAKGKVAGFSSDAREIDYSARLNLSSIKSDPVNKQHLKQKLGNIDLEPILQSY